MRGGGGGSSSALQQLAEPAICRVLGGPRGESKRVAAGATGGHPTIGLGAEPLPTDWHVVGGLGQDIEAAAAAAAPAVPPTISR